MFDIHELKRITTKHRTRKHQDHGKLSCLTCFCKAQLLRNEIRPFVCPFYVLQQFTSDDPEAVTNCGPGI